MDIALILWLVPLATALVLMQFGVLTQRRFANEITIALLLVSLIFVPVIPVAWPLRVIQMVFQLWIVVLPARMIWGNLNKEFTYRSSLVNSHTAFVVQALIFASVAIMPDFSRVYPLLGALICGASIAVSLVVFRQLAWSGRHFALPGKTHDLKHLPTVSLCIPARNEDHALAECLIAALASDYPKLEILVYDDDSQDKTAMIIKDFAQQGVRFVAGDKPAEGWLGKNLAMNKLAHEASGDYLVYISADTHLAPESIGLLIEYAITNGYEMVSVLPQNRLSPMPGTLMPTLQYFWQMVWPVSRGHIPTSSKCWAISASALERLGGFGGIRNKIIPEVYFAQLLFGRHLYRFLVSNDKLNITTAKRWSSQIDTSLRLVYPQQKRQPLLALTGALLISAIWLAPMGILFGFIIGQGGLTITSALAVISSLSGWLSYVIFLRRTQPKSWIAASLLWPVVLTQEVALNIASMCVYEFGAVNWKDRRTTPQLY